jgi:hypothetical protein
LGGGKFALMGKAKNLVRGFNIIQKNIYIVGNLIMEKETVKEFCKCFCLQTVCI